MENSLLITLQSIDNWFTKNKFKGYDPYDLLDTVFFHKLITNKPVLVRKINRKIISWFVFLFPKLVIKVFNKQPNINPKAMGLLLKGYCNLYKVSNEEKFLLKAKQIADWLIDNRSKGIQGYGWGYPFDWSGSKFIPKYTPSSVVSTVCGDGFYELYKITNNEKYLEVCDGICNFIINDLNIDFIGKNQLCFSYTPIDNDHVINANLFSAEFLIRIGKEKNNSRYLELAKKAINYTLNQQKPNGDFLYWGKEDNRRLKFSRSNTDHYHTGFELRTLYKLWKLLKDNKIERSLKRYYKFYVKNFINDDSSINLYPLRKFPINIHACSEFIYCNSIIGEEFKSNRVNIGLTIDWINAKMQNTNRLYIYEIRKVFGIIFKNKFEFHRWSQAWMFIALSEYLLLKKNEDKK